MHAKTDKFIQLARVGAVFGGWEGGIALGDRVVVLSSGPASRVVRSFDVNLERPRNVAEIKLDERFTDLYRDIWACLRGEVEKSYARQD